MLTITLAVLAIVIIACTCSLTPLIGGGGEAVPGLAGRWQDPETYTIHVVEWNGSAYVVSDSIDDDGEDFVVTEQSWSGGVLTWTYRVGSSDTYVTFETISVSGDNLYTNWWNTTGDYGTETLERVR